MVQGDFWFDARTQRRDVAYWRDKRGHEVNFVLARLRPKPLAIECKWSADSFEPTNLRAFRQQHPEGENVVVAQDVGVGVHSKLWRPESPLRKPQCLCQLCRGDVGVGLALPL